MSVEMGILFQDKFCELRFEKSEDNAVEWWWEEPEDMTVFVVSFCPLNYPALVVHRMTADMAQDELNKLFNEGWDVIERDDLKFLYIPEEEE